MKNMIYFKKWYFVILITAVLLCGCATAKMLGQGGVHSETIRVSGVSQETLFAFSNKFLEDLFIGTNSSIITLDEENGIVRGVHIINIESHGMTFSTFTLEASRDSVKFSASYASRNEIAQAGLESFRAQQAAQQRAASQGGSSGGGLLGAGISLVAAGAQDEARNRRLVQEWSKIIEEFKTASNSTDWSVPIITNRQQAEIDAQIIIRQTEKVSMSTQELIDSNSFIIQNEIGIDIFGGLVLQQGRTAWGPDILPYGLANGASLNIQLSSNHAHIQLMLYGVNGGVYMFQGSLPEDRVIRITSLNHRQTTPEQTPVFKIRNNTGEITETASVRINRGRQDGSWTPVQSLGGSTAIANTSSIIVSGMSPSAHGQNITFDYQLRTSAGVTYTRINFAPTTGATLTFTERDRD